MAAKAKKNPYEGKIELYIDGRPAEEYGSAYVSALVLDWFIRSMYRSCRNDPAYANIYQWEYSGIDCEQYKKSDGK